MATRRYIIEGRVQGVGFRDYVFHNACDLHITGWVKNLVNGNVECLAFGDDQALRKLEAQLWSGPSFSQVTHIDITEETLEMAPNNFLIV